MLRDQILRSQVNDTARNQTIEFIKEAIEKGLDEFACSSMQREMVKASQEQDWAYLLALHLFTTAAFEKFGLKILVPHGVETRMEAVQILERSIAWERVLQNIRVALTGDRRQGELQIAIAKNDVEHLRSDYPKYKREKYFLLKARFGFARWNSEFFQLLPIQQKVIREIDPIKQPALWLKEVSLLVSVAISQQEWEIVNFWIMRMFSVAIPQATEKYRKKLCFKNSIIYAIYSGRDSVGYRALREIDYIDSWASGEEIASYRYLSSLFLLFAEDYSRSLEISHQLLSMPTKERRKFTWQPLIMIGLCKLSLGSFDGIDSITRRIERSAKNDGVQTPVIFWHIVRENFIVGHNPEIIASGISAIQEMQNAPEEHFANHYFFFIDYLKAIQNGTSLQDELQIGDVIELKSFGN